MPKALAKTKHGQKAMVQEPSSSMQGESGSKDVQGAIPSGKIPGSMDSHSHRKGAKHSSASSRVEKRRDKVLKKLCDKASGHRSLPPVGGTSAIPSDVMDQGLALTLDQMSLQDCPVTIQASDLWGSAPLPSSGASTEGTVPATSSALV